MFLKSQLILWCKRVGLNWCRVGNFETAVPGKGGKAAEGGGVNMVPKLWCPEEWYGMGGANRTAFHRLDTVGQLLILSQSHFLY